MVNRILDTTSKTKATQEKINKWGFIRSEGFFPSKDTIKKVMDNPQNGRPHLQIMCLERHFYLEYTKSSYNSVMKDKATN